MAQRLVRAKKEISAANIPYRIPGDAELHDRLRPVPAVVYLIYNDGHTVSAGDQLVRDDLCREAVRLSRLLVELIPDEPEAGGLLALLLLTEARRPARVAADGSLVLLPDQDRTLWDGALIEEGQTLVRACLRRNQTGPYQIQAAINAVHTDAARAKATDWAQILARYDQLLVYAPTAVVSLNRAVALSEVSGPEAGLRALDELDLAAYHPYHADARRLPCATRPRRRGASRLDSDRADGERGRARGARPATRRVAALGAGPFRRSPGRRIRVGSGSFRMAATRGRRHPGAMNTTTTDTDDIPATRRLTRSRSDRMVAGVSGGLARYFDIHPAVFRVGFVVLTLLGGAGILIYAAAALVMPDEGKDDSVATAALRNRRDRPWPLIGLGLLAVAGAILLSRVTLSLNGDSWFLFLLAGAVILWITRQPASEPAADGSLTPPPSAAELAKRDSRRLRRVGKWLAITFATLIALVLIAAAAFFAIFDVDLGNGVGDRNVAVTNVRNLQNEYQLGIGTLDLDLRRLTLPVGETHVRASVDVGDLRVLVPDDVALRANGSAEIGEVDLPGGVSGSGRNVESSVTETGPRVLVIDGHAGLGSVRIERGLP